MKTLRVTDLSEETGFSTTLDLDDLDRVTAAPPSLNFMAGWDLMQVAAYCRRQGWTLAPDIEGVTDAVEL